MSLQQTRRPNPWVASLLSAMLPGAGHVYAGRRRLGVRLIVIDFALLALAAVAVLFFQTEVLKAWASLESLSLVMIANLVLLSYRGWASYDAFGHVPKANSGSPIAATALGIGVWLLVLSPHVVVGYYNLVQYSLISEVFEEPESPSAATGDGTGVNPDPTGTTVGAPTLWDGLERLNLLLVGSDVGVGRESIRTDTMIVVSVDPVVGDMAMISLPRNLSGIDLPPGHGIWDCNCFPQLLNDLYHVAESNPDWFPGAGEPGPRALKTAIGDLLDLEIHYYALATLDGFVGIVDALGGVDIDVPSTIIDETYPHEDGVTVEHVVIESGPQHLDGHLALAYARIRRHADDFARMNRQRCVLGAVIAQSSPLELLAAYPAIAEVMKETLATDIPQDRLVDFIDLIPIISLDRVVVLHVDREYISGTDPGRTYYDQERIRSDTQSILGDPGNARDGLSLENTCA